MREALDIMGLRVQKLKALRSGLLDNCSHINQTEFDFTLLEQLINDLPNYKVALIIVTSYTYIHEVLQKFTAVSVSLDPNLDPPKSNKFSLKGIKITKLKVILWLSLFPIRHRLAFEKKRNTKETKKENK